MNFKNEARMQELGEKEDDFAFYRMLHKEYIAALENFVKLLQQGPNNEELLYR